MGTIRTVTGDLLSAFDQKIVSAIGHSCNCFCTFGKGLALAIKNRYPRAYDADQMTKKGDKYKLGQFSLSQQDNGGFILNIYGQYAYGYKTAHTDYSALTQAFESVKLWMQKMELTTLGLPHKIGCGLGGGNWDTVLAAIKYAFQDSDIEVTIFRLE